MKTAKIFLFIMIFVIGSYSNYSYSQDEQFHWYNSSRIPYLIEKPSGQQILQYQKYFEVNRDTSWTPSHKLFGSIFHETAVTDFISGTQNGLFDSTVNYQLIFWRLNELYPLENKSGTIQEKYDKLNSQIDSLLSYECETMFDWRVTESVRSCLRQTVVSYFQDCFIKASENDEDFQLIIELWNRYYNATRAVCSAVISDYDGSGADFGRMEYDQQINKQYDLWLFFLMGIRTDEKISNHFTISDEIFKESYDRIIIRTTKGYNVQYVTGRYTLEEKINNLREECETWLEWLNALRAYSIKHPSLNIELLIQQIARNKLVELKNEYTQYDMYGTDLDEKLLKNDCSDQELMNFVLDWP